MPWKSVYLAFCRVILQAEHDTIFKNGYSGIIRSFVFNAKQKQACEFTPAFESYVFMPDTYFQVLQYEKQL